MALGQHENHALEYALMVLSVGLALSGIFLARAWYTRRKDIPDSLAGRFAPAYKLLLNKYYVDEVYEAAVVTPIRRASEGLLWKGLDVGVIDWTVNAVARLFGMLSRSLRVVQTGMAQSYVLVFVVGVIVMLAWLLAK